MNERIKLLIAQAGMTLTERQLYDEENYPGYECSDNDHFDDNLEATRVFFEGGLEKFAELLVKECTNIVLHYTDVDEGVAVAKKHFGVE
jgi:hypothetical protein